MEDSTEVITDGAVITITPITEDIIITVEIQETTIMVEEHPARMITGENTILHEEVRRVPPPV